MHRQIEAQLRLAIRNGALRPGTLLPSSRMLAQQLGVSRGVVVEAYGQLVAEGYLHASARVAPRVADGSSAGATGAMSPPVTLAPAPRFNLNPGVPALDAFPREAWAAAVRRVLRDTPDSDLGYPAPEGHPHLRAALADYLARVRGADASAERLVITQGATQALSLACQALRARGVDRIALEDPSHRDEREIVIRAGLTIIPIPVDDRGLDVEALADSDAQAVLLTPAHQFPTGVLLSPERRADLLRWLDDDHRFVIEDDYDAEFRYAGNPVGAVQGLRPEQVMYTSSVSKSLIPGLRIGWLLLPSRLVAETAERKRYLDLGSPTLDQLALSELIVRGEFDRHVRRLRARYRRQQAALVGALRQHFPSGTILGIPAGLHLAIEADEWPEDRLRRASLDASIAIGGVSDHLIAARRPPTLLLGFALHTEAVLRDAVKKLAEVAARL